MSEVETQGVQDTTEAPKEQATDEQVSEKLFDVAKEQLEGSEKEEGGEAKEEVKEEAKAPEVPEKYDLKVPDAVKVDAAYLEEIESYAKTQGFSQDQAQSLLDRELQVKESAFKTGQETLQKELKVNIEKYKEAGLTELKADKDFGGDHFNENVQHAMNALQEFFPGDEVKQVLYNSGLGSSPQIVRGLARIGKMYLAEDKRVDGETGKTKKKSMSDVLFDKSSALLNGG